MLDGECFKVPIQALHARNQRRRDHAAYDRVPRPSAALQTPRSLPRFSARRRAAFGANGLRSVARNFLDSAADNVATDSAETVQSASRSTAVRTNAANGSPAKAAARARPSRAFS